ncbi:MAG: energy-coupled thiamine transporter ThiT [Clostridiales bacterium]|nr:energy-coupled thiamine transporter ThiT [Clostridiales bacterium]
MINSLLSGFGEYIFENMKQYFTNFDGLTNASRSSMLWIAIALTIGIIVCKLVIPKDKQPLVNKISLGVILAYVITSIVLFTVCYFLEVSDKEEYFFPLLYYPLLALVLVAVGSALAIYLKPLKWVKITCASLTGAALVAAIVCVGFHFASGDYIEPNWFESAEDVNTLGLYISAVILVAVIAVPAILFDKNSTGWDTRSLTFAAVCVGMSFALSYIRIVKMPFGGSITFASMLPLMLFAYMFGARKGVIAGLVYGCLQAIQDPYVVHPAQFVLDYLVAFSALGLTGILRSFNLFNGNKAQFALGATIAGVLRYIAHFFSGAFAFGSFGAWYTDVWEGFSNAYVYSLVYNALYVIPEIIIVVVVGVLLFTSKNFTNQVEKYTLMGTKKVEKAEASAETTAE